MRHLKLGAAAALGLTVGAIFAAPLAASTATTALFGQLRLGEWEFRERGAERPRRVCLRSESDLVQLRSDGIERGSPFSLEAEGRRVGNCR